jgi:hypothetical protein
MTLNKGFADVTEHLLELGTPKQLKNKLKSITKTKKTTDLKNMGKYSKQLEQTKSVVRLKNDKKDTKVQKPKI